MVEVVDLRPEFESGLVDGLEVVAPTELLFEGFDETLAQPVLLWSVWGDVFLFESKVVHQGAIESRSKDPAVVMAKQHVRRGTTQCAKAGEQGFFQGALGGFSSACRLSA